MECLCPRVFIDALDPIQFSFWIIPYNPYSISEVTQFYLASTAFTSILSPFGKVISVQRPLTLLGVNSIMGVRYRETKHIFLAQASIP